MSCAFQIKHEYGAVAQLYPKAAFSLYREDERISEEVGARCECAPSSL